MTGADLKDARRQLGLSQAQLVKALGVHLRTLSRWETDVTPIPHRIVILIALALKSPKSRKSLMDFSRNPIFAR
jgi:transcriptional regulator with XRE-family HTH domain